MDLSLPGSPNHPLSTAAVFADNVQDLLGTGALQVHPTGIIAVNSIDDAVNSSSGVTTLRDAINKANAEEGVDLIVFERSLFSSAQTISLNLGELDITHSLDIIAPRDTLTGADLVTVSGNKASRVFEIEAGAKVNFSGLIVADGSVTGDVGGGIKNSGTLTLDSSIVRNNAAIVKITNYGRYSTRSGGDGGGIYNNIRRTLKVNNSIISDNSAGSTGGGIYNSVGIATVRNSTISGNTAGSDGGGIINYGTSTVSNSTVSGNTAANGGGILTSNEVQIIRHGKILNRSSMVVSSSTISGNSARGNGGGIGNQNGDTILTVSNSTISDNMARLNGGGIYNVDEFDQTFDNNMVSNSTISGNSATLGGGIYNDYSGTLKLLFSTVTQNQAANGGGVYQNDVPLFSDELRGSFNVRNTIIAANLNSANGVNPDIGGTFTSNGYNLIGNDGTGSTGFGSTGDIIGSSAKPINPRLGVLAFNGGRTQTIALLQGSPAINAGDPTLLPTDPTTDQRGKPRVRQGRADIGAFESSAT